MKFLRQDKQFYFYSHNNFFCFDFSFVFLFYCFANFPAGNSVTIECNYFMDEWWPIEGRKYECVVTNSDMFNGSLVNIEKAEGEHLDGKSDDDVKFLMININLGYFPTNLENVFKNLELIYMSFANLTELTSGDLKPFPKLKSLVLFVNSIEVIKEDLFIHNPELEGLDLSFNKISHIDPKSFSHLNKLIYLNLSNNLCKIDGKNEAATKSNVLELVKKIEQGQCLSLKYTKITISTTTTEDYVSSIENMEKNQANSCVNFSSVFIVVAIFQLFSEIKLNF